jgi:quercetin dioxygenase-like cupin family protein
MSYMRVILTVLLGLSASSVAAQPSYPAEQLLSTTRTVVGEEIRYPQGGQPRVKMAIVTIQPGTATALHRHPTPLVAYVLEGQVTVDYGVHGLKTFKQGDAFVEAMDVAHRGMNRGTTVVRLLAVYIGSEGVPEVVIER